MKHTNSHFWYNKSQRNGVLLLVALIIIAQLIYLYVDFSNAETVLDENELDFYQAKIDSIKLSQKRESAPKIYPFNPNYLSDFKAYQLGMSVFEIDNLLAYRKTGKFINTAKEFQQVTLINDSLLRVISPYFKFPEWTKKPKPKQENSNTEIISVKDLNQVDESDLKSISGIGEKLSKRIVSYRKMLGGFTFNDQLYEVYYLDSTVAKRVLKRYQVLSKPTIEKLNLNDAEFKEVLALPYIDYDLTKKLINYRNSVNQIKALEDLKKIDSFPLDKFDRIALYLLAE